MAKRQSAIDIAAQMEVIRAQIVELSETDGSDEEIDAAVKRSNELLDEFKELEAARAAAVEYEKKVEAVRGLALMPQNREPGDGGQQVTRARGPEVLIKNDPFADDPRHLTTGEVISRAMTVIDREKYVPISDSNKAYLDTLVHRSQEADDPEGAQFDGTYLARRVLLTENPVYRAAFKKYSRLGALAQFDAREQAAIAAYQNFELSRAASEGTTTAGGFGVPVMIDPTIIITSGAADAPILRVCRTEPVTNNIWKGVSSAGMSWSYDAEAAEVSDDMATLAQPSVTVYMPRGFIPYSIEIQQDYPGFAAEMGRLLDQGYTDLLASQTVVGSGSSSPRGIFTALDANTNVEVVTTTDGSFGGVDVFKVWNALPERYRSRATWVMSVHVESAIRQFAAAAGSSSAYFTVDLTADGVSRINGRPVITTDYAPTFASGVPGTTGAANILVVGDFSNYVIAQRAGMSIEQVPMMFGSSGRRPTGQRGIFAWARHGADSVNDLGFRLLQNA